jgi:acetylornithine aminotransferase
MSDVTTIPETSAILRLDIELAEKYDTHFNEEVGLGLMRGLRAKDAKTQSDILAAAMRERVVVLKAGRNTVRFLPPLTITKDEIDEGFARFENALAKL